MIDDYHDRQLDGINPDKVGPVGMMTAMSAEVKAAIIGLVGVVVGAGLTIFGAWLQQRGQEKAAKRERHEIRGASLAETALNELIVVRQALTDGLEGDGSSYAALSVARESLSRAEMAALTIPNSEALRTRLEDVFRLYGAKGWTGAVRATYRISWNLAATDEGVEILAAFLRGERLPEPSASFVERQRKVEEATAAREARDREREINRTGPRPS